MQIVSVMCSSMSCRWYHLPKNWMAISTNVWLIVKSFSYKFSILLFASFYLTCHQHHIALYRRQKANPPIAKKPTGGRPPDLSRTFWVTWDDHRDMETLRCTGSFHLTCSDPNFNFWISHVLWTKYELITHTLDEIRPNGICCSINPTATAKLIR